MTRYLSLFNSCSTLRSLTQLHAHLLVTGLYTKPQASTKLIESYAQLGNHESARNVFATYPNPISFLMWSVIVKYLVWNGSYNGAISLYSGMVRSGVELSCFVIPFLLRACSGYGDLKTGEIVHGSLVKSGFERDDDDIDTELMSMYGEFGCVDSARKVFDDMSVRDVVSWSSMVSIHVQNGQTSEGLGLFRWMIFDQIEVEYDVMLSVSEAAGDLGCRNLARSVHGFSLRQQFVSSESSDGSLENSILLMYLKCGDLCSVETLFRTTANQSVSSWTSMISNYNQFGYHENALAVFREMIDRGIQPNSMTMTSVIASCAALCLLREGKACHGYVLSRALDPSFEFVGPALLDLYVACGRAIHSKNIFALIGKKNRLFWNKLISVYARQGLLDEALEIYKQMQIHGFSPDSFTLSTLLSSCSRAVSSKLVRQLHTRLIKTGEPDENVQNSLIDTYSQSGFLDSATTVFQECQERSSVTWNTVMCSLLQNGNSEKAITLFDQMYKNRLEMNEVTFLTAIQACSNLGDLKKGEWLHHKIISHGITSMYIETALIDMYAKGGSINTAKRVFDSMKEKNVASWSAMIAGLGSHGLVTDLISLFDEMVKSGVKPNEVAFLNILSGCSHAGFVEQGKKYFDLMTRDYGIEPKIEHFSCMVDLLSRAGDVDGAYRIIKTMPFAADVSIWGSLLIGCGIHRRIDMVRKIEVDLVNVPTRGDPGFYTLLSSTHAECKDYDESQRVRSVMGDTGLKKVSGTIKK